MGQQNLSPHSRAHNTVTGLAQNGVNLSPGKNAEQEGLATLESLAQLNSAPVEPVGSKPIDTSPEKDSPELLCKEDISIALPENLDSLEQSQEPNTQIRQEMEQFKESVTMMQQEMSSAADSSRLWSRFFCHNSPVNLTVQIPANWANFFTVLLLSPTHFSWARDIVTSELMNLLHNPTGSTAFSIPDTCPNYVPTHCLTDTGVHQQIPRLVEEVQDNEKEPKSSSKKRTSKEPLLSDKEVRRSERVKNKANGFKSPSCSDKRCLSCSPTPPTLSVKLMQTLGSKLGGLSEEELQEDNLNKKKLKTLAVERKKKTVKGKGVAEEGPTKAMEIED